MIAVCLAAGMAAPALAQPEAQTEHKSYPCKQTGQFSADCSGAMQKMAEDGYAPQPTPHAWVHRAVDDEPAAPLPQPKAKGDECLSTAKDTLVALYALHSIMTEQLQVEITTLRALQQIAAPRDGQARQAAP